MSRGATRVLQEQSYPMHVYVENVDAVRTEEEEDGSIHINSCANRPTLNKHSSAVKVSLQ